MCTLRTSTPGELQSKQAKARRDGCGKSKTRHARPDFGRSQNTRRPYTTTRNAKKTSNITPISPAVTRLLVFPVREHQQQWQCSASNGCYYVAAVDRPPGAHTFQAQQYTPDTTYTGWVPGSAVYAPKPQAVLPVTATATSYLTRTAHHAHHAKCVYSLEPAIHSTSILQHSKRTTTQGDVTTNAGEGVC